MTRIIPTAALAGAALIATAANSSAQSAATAPQVREAAPPTAPAARPAGSLAEREWLRADSEGRRRISEKLGELEARKWARAQSLEPVQPGGKKSIRGGYDQVWKNPKTGEVIVIEAKGFQQGKSAKYGTSSGLRQATPEYDVAFAKKVQKMTAASDVDRKAGKMILEAASKGKLLSVAYETEHAAGRVIRSVKRSAKPVTAAAKSVARTALWQAEAVAPRSTRVAANSAGGVTRTAGRVFRTAGRAAGPVLVVVDAGLRVRDAVDIQNDASLSIRQREKAHVENAAGFAGGMAGAAGGAQAGAMAGAAAGSFVPVVGTAIGAGLGTVGGGAVGYMVGDAAVSTVAAAAVDAVHGTGRTIGGAARSAGRTASRGVRNTGRAVGRIWKSYSPF